MTDSTPADSQRTTPGVVTEAGLTTKQRAHLGALRDYCRHPETVKRATACCASCVGSWEGRAEVLDEVLATPARSSLPPDFGKLMDELEITARREGAEVLYASRAEDTRNVDATAAARAALEAAIATLGKCSVCRGTGKCVARGGNVSYDQQLADAHREIERLTRERDEWERKSKNNGLAAAIQTERLEKSQRSAPLLTAEMVREAILNTRGPRGGWPPEDYEILAHHLNAHLNVRLAHGEGKA